MALHPTIPGYRLLPMYDGDDEDVSVVLLRVRNSFARVNSAHFSISASYTRFIDSSSDAITARYSRMNCLTSAGQFLLHTMRPPHSRGTAGNALIGLTRCCLPPPACSVSHSVDVQQQQCGTPAAHNQMLPRVQHGTT